MRVYLNVALCKKCPYSIFRLCHYKRLLYGKIPKLNSKIKMMHNCTFYRNIFRKGQYVLVDLYDQVPAANGKWLYVPVYKDVPGVIKGNRGNKFVVELFEPYFLIRKKRGKPPTCRLKVYYECTRVAKDIRRLVLNEQSAKVRHKIPEKMPVLN